MATIAHPSRSPWLLLAVLAALATLLTSCAEDSERLSAIIRVSDQGTTSVFIAILDEPITEADVETRSGEELTIEARHIVVTGIRPGDYTVHIELNGAAATIRVPDLRPKTTAIVYLVHANERQLGLVSHRRFTANFDDTGATDWVAEENGND